MKKNNLLPLLLSMFILTTTFSSCQAIADIFKAGVWVGVLIVVGVIALIVFAVSRKK